jgi:heme-degrading monooxygenase HmoA
MIVRLTSFNIIPNKVEELTQLYNQEIVPFVKKQKGNLDCRLLEPMNKADDYISMTVWEDKNAADAYHSGGAYRQQVEKVKQFFTNNAVLKTYKAEDVMEHA